MRFITVLCAVLLLAGFSFSVPINTCQVINGAGVYTLNQSIINGVAQSYGYHGTTCIGINTSNVVLDCAGFTISAGAAGMSDAIISGDSQSSASLTNVTIANCTITGNFTNFGISVHDSPNGKVIRNTVHDVNSNGIGLFDVNTGNLVANNTVFNNRYSGFQLTYGPNNLFNNTAYNNGDDGFSFSTGTTNNLTRCTAYNNSYGFYVGGESSGNWIVNSSAFNNTNNGFHIREGGTVLIGDNSYNNANDGYYVEGWGGFSATPYVDITNSNATSNGNHGLYLLEVSWAVVDPSYFCNNTGAEGVLVSNSTNVTIINSVACNNAYHGIHLSNTNYSNVSGNTAYNNGGNGIILYGGSSNNYVGNNTAYGNTGAFSPGFGSDGIYLGSNSNHNRVVDNMVYDNVNTGISVTDSTNNTLTHNFATLQRRWYGIYLHDAYNTTASLNFAYNNDNATGGNGFVIVGGSGHNLTSNEVYGNGVNGIYLSSTNRNTLTNNSAFNNGNDGIRIEGGTIPAGSDNKLVMNTVFNNAQSGIRIINANNTNISGGHLYLNNPDLNLERNVMAEGFSRLITVSGLVFDSSSGYVNYTNLSFTDNLYNFDHYTLDWSAQPATLPGSGAFASFRNKYINITNLTTNVSLDSVTWHWQVAELPGFIESRLELWKYNVSGWTKPAYSTGTNSFSVSNLNPFSVFAIIQNNGCPAPITTPGTHTMIGNYLGAPNPASPVAGTACVKIAASHVVLDCNGFGIMNNGTAGTTHGIVLNGSLTNVTVRNCPNVSGYTSGIYAYNVTGTAILNNTVNNNSLYGIMLNESASNSIRDNKAFNQQFGFFVSGGSRNNFTDNNATNNSANGFHLQQSANNNSLSNNYVQNSTNYTGPYGHGFHLENSHNNTLNSNRAYNNARGIWLEVASTNNLSGNNVTVCNAEAMVVRSSSGNRLERNYASGCSAGIYLGTTSSTNNLVFNNTLAGGSQYGIQVVSVGAGNNITQNNASGYSYNGYYLFNTNTTNYFINNTAYNNPVGFNVTGSNLSVFNYNTARGTSQNGFSLYQSNSNNLTENRAYQNSVMGFRLQSSNGNRLSGNLAYNNTQAGLYLYSSQQNLLSNNTAYRNQNGIATFQASGNAYGDNALFNNTNAGIYLDGSSNNLTNNSAYNNTIYGIQLMFSSSLNRLMSNSAFQNGIIGFYVYSDSNNNLLWNNTASGGQIGFDVNMANNNNLTENTALGPSTGSAFLIETSNNTRLTGNNVRATGRGITVQLSSLDTVLENNTVNGSANAGLEVRSGADRTSVRNDHYYGNSPDFRVNGTGITVNLSGVVFDNPAGDYTNYTNLSLNDTVASAYSIDWTDNSTSIPLPPKSISFAQKFVNITPLEGTVSIDSVVWHWLSSELAGYNDAEFQLWKHNGTWAPVSPRLLNRPARTLSTTGLSTFSVFAILQVESPDEDEVEVSSEPFEVNIVPACQGFIVRVTDAGNPVNDSFVTGADVTHGVEFAPRYTNASGEAYVSDCDIDVTIDAVKSGRSGTVSGSADCGICPACATDDDCAESASCVNFQCVPVDCPNGRIVDHGCVMYECTVDADCPAGKLCKDHLCVYECTSNSTCAAAQYCDIPAGAAGGSCMNVTMQRCGEIRNHIFVPYGYQCGSEPGCPTCGQGFYCNAYHRCIQNDVSCPTTGLVGDNKTCEAKENNMPCVNCAYVITDPAGRNSSGRTDENGNFVLPLSMKGTYKVTLLKDGMPVRIVEVKALPVSPGGGEEAPGAAGGTDAGTMALALIILLALGIAIFLYWRRGKGEKKQKK